MHQSPASGTAAVSVHHFFGEGRLPDQEYLHLCVVRKRRMERSLQLLIKTNRELWIGLLMFV
jgi:hypothetical protein